MSTATEQRIAVMRAIDAFCEMATAHPQTPRHEWGVYGFRADKPGQKYTRIIMTVTDAQGVCKDNSVHAFVGNDTGDLFMAAGYSAPAKGARYNLLTEYDVVEANFRWAGDYLYKAHVRRPVAS
jgi:hypothetical protein